MKAEAVNKNINAWPIISKWLAIMEKRQTDLAGVLNISASAVSQIKSGSILLNAKQISLILEYLEINSRDMCALYTLIFNARLNNRVASDKKLIVNIANLNKEKDISVFSELSDFSSDCQDLFRKVPLMTFKQAMNYEPALESIESFARDCSEQTALFSNAQIGNLAFFVDEKNVTPEFAHSAVLLVSSKEYPVHGDMVVAKLRTGEFITKYYLHHDNVILLKSKDSNIPSFTWRYQEDPGYVQWMYPIIEANLKLRSDNYNFTD